MALSPQKKQAIAREDHPAAQVVSSFLEMREGCRFYRGIKNTPESLQCTHPGASRASNWCALHDCPLVEERADYHSVGPR